MKGSRRGFGSLCLVAAQGSGIFKNQIPVCRVTVGELRAGKGACPRSRRKGRSESRAERQEAWSHSAASVRPSAGLSGNRFSDSWWLSQNQVHVVWLHQGQNQIPGRWLPVRARGAEPAMVPLSSPHQLDGGHQQEHISHPALLLVPLPPTLCSPAPSRSPLAECQRVWKSATV